MTDRPDAMTQADRAIAAEAILAAIYNEYTLARRKFAPLNSGHEGWAVIKEELDELWEEVRNDMGAGSGARGEAIQIAAMALAYAVEVCDD